MKLNLIKEPRMYIIKEQGHKIEQFQYRSSIVFNSGGIDKNVSQGLRRPKEVFEQLVPIWGSQQLRRTKLRILKTNIKLVILNGCETWNVTKSINNYIRRIFNI